MPAISQDAAIGAAKLLGVVGVAAFTAIALICKEDLTPFKAILYTVAGGVCVCLMWPNQAQGQAVLNLGKVDKKH